MSLLSRLFRKAPSSSPAPPPVPVEKSGQAQPAPGAADRAQATAAEEKALQSAIDAGDVSAVARFVVAGTSTRVRQAAAQAIEDPEWLRQLIREVRGGNDNGVYRILTGKRDALTAQARQLEQLRAEIQAASEALERHSQGPYNTSYGPLLEQFESRWNKVSAEADPGRREEVRQWIDHARETIAGHFRQLAAEASREQAAAEAAAETLRRREQQAEAAAAEAAEQAAAIEEQQRAHHEKQQAGQQALRHIGELIRKARGALGDGGTARAAGVRRAIEQQLATAPPLPTHLATQIQQLDQQLAEFKDWKSFSVAPKRTELIEEMELLIGISLEPLALAERIRSIQDEWRTLGKGAGENLEADALRFQQAAQKAYQPCSEYFAAQARVRAGNLKRREALLEKLIAFEAGNNWEKPDWRAVTKTLQEVKQEWRQCSPVDRDAAKPQQESFTALTASLQSRLDAEHAGNRRQKESLIERAQALLAIDDGRKAIDAVKTLQQQWQAVGAVPREVDQRLWTEFRRHCDAVFQKRDQVAAAHTAGLEGNKAQAIALCEQLEQIAALEGAELLARAAARGELRKAFEALGEFPRADTRELRQRFDRGLERCEAGIKRQHARDAERAWDDLFAAANPVRAYQLAVAQGLDMAQIDTLKAAAETGIAAVPQWPKGGLDALRQALAAGHSADLAASEAALRMLCIRAEILTDTPTPEEDQPLRRDYQLQRLVQGMGQRLKADETPLDAMAIEWVRTGPVEEAVYGPLVQRFRRCRERGQASVRGR